MRLVVLSDIHANIEALDAVAADVASIAPGERMICLGDMIGYGADPEAVVSRVRELGMTAVLGNHEMGAARPSSRDRFNPQAWEAVCWAASRLSPGNLAWIKTLPEWLCVEGCRFVHGLPPGEVDTYLFQASSAKVVKAMQAIPESVSFVGHTHQLRLVSLAGQDIKGSKLPEGDSVLDPSTRHIVNAGAVGQPRDGDPRAKYCLFDTATRTLTVRYVPYDNRAAAWKIIQAGQPAVFAARLADLDP